MGSITDVPGIKVGQVQNEEALTGLSVVLVPDGAVAGVDVRGAAPGTRETDLLDPANLVHSVNAIALCGGSAFGLAAVDGVVNYLREIGVGFDTPAGKVPIVPAAVIYDLAVGQPGHFPDAAMGYRACREAGSLVLEGNFGAGCGATVGKILGPGNAMKSGVGTASAKLNLARPDLPVWQYSVGTLVVTNAFGDIYQGDRIVAGVCRHPDGELLDTLRLLNGDGSPGGRPTPGTNTTLAVVATDAPLTKAAAQRLAIMTQDGLSRAIRPAHTMFDGDVVFGLSTGGLPASPLVDPLLLTALGSLAAETLAKAILRSVLEASPVAGLPSCRRVL